MSRAVFQTTECRVTCHDDGSWPISCTLIDQVEHPSLLTSYPGQYRCTFTLSFGFPPIFPPGYVAAFRHETVVFEHFNIFSKLFEALAYCLVVLELQLRYILE